MNTEGQDNGLSGGPIEFSTADDWITARLNQVIETTTQAINNYRFDLAAQAIYEFTWNEYCDWYLELAKISLLSENQAQQQGTRKNAFDCFRKFAALIASDHAIYYRGNLATSCATHWHFSCNHYASTIP